MNLAADSEYSNYALILCGFTVEKCNPIFFNN